MPRVTEPPGKLLDLIYDAATEQELWTRALIQIANMTDSLGGFVVGVEYKDRLVPFLFNGRMSEESHRNYAERHIDNPWSAVMNHAPTGKLVQSAEIISLPELKRTAFFDEVLRPQKMAHNAMLTLARKDDFFGVFNICRSERQGPFEEGVLRFFAQLYPHMRRSLLLGFRLDAYKALQRAEFQVLDRLSAGIILLDCAARVVFVNAAARAMAESDGPLRLRNSLLAAVSAMHSQQLRQLVELALRGSARCRDPVSTQMPHSHFVSDGVKMRSIPTRVDMSASAQLSDGPLACVFLKSQPSAHSWTPDRLLLPAAHAAARAPGSGQATPPPPAA